MKTFFAKAMFGAMLWLQVAGCGEDLVDGRVQIQLVAPCEPSLEQIQAEVDNYCIRVERSDGQLLDQSCAGSLDEIELKMAEVSSQVILVVEGLAANNPVVRGRSAKVRLISGDKMQLTIPLALVGSFALMAAEQVGCRSLPYSARGHAATVFPSGHVLVTGTVAKDVPVGQTAFLVDPMTAEMTLLSVPADLHRGYHSATLLADGRVVVLGGVTNTGPTTRDIHVLRGAEPLTQDYDLDFNYPGSLSFESIENGLAYQREHHDAIRFYGDQVLVTDGASRAEMFLGASETSGVVHIGGGADPYPVSSGRIVTTVPVNQGEAVLLGGLVDHNGLLSVRDDGRQIVFQPFDLDVSQRGAPLGIRLPDGRVMFLGGKSLLVASESPVLLVDRTVPELTEVSVDEESFPFQEYTATLLADGRVFVVGGSSPNANFVPGSTFFIEEQTSGLHNFRVVPGPPLNMPRAGHTASLLPDGRLLVMGGRAAGPGVTNHDVSVSAEVVTF